MKFLFEYRTSDNVHHDGVICAASRDAAFAFLRKQGIRPGRLVEAPGFFNKLFGKGKRWIAIAVLAVVSVSLSVVALRPRSADESLALLDSAMRRQIVGDAAVVAKGVATGWSEIFSRPGDRYLASFAIPGYPPAVTEAKEDAVREALALRIESESSDTLEARQVKAIVNGIKDELNEFLVAGGSVRQFCRLLMRRQQEELMYYTRAKAEIESLANAPRDQMLEVWERRNAQLRRMGVRLVALPGED